MTGGPHYDQVSSRTGPGPYQGVLASCLKNRDGTCTACQRLSDVERKIDEMRVPLSHLLDEREVMVAGLNEEHDPFANRLPFEIASYVFAQCKPAPPEVHKRYDEARLFEAIFTPGQVCTNWRRIAQGTPELWTTVCVSITKERCRFVNRMVKKWLKRSGNLPLFLQLSTEEEYGAAKFLDLALKHVHRWETLDMAVPFILLPWITKPLKKPLHHLQHFKFNVYNTSPRDFAKVLHLNASPRMITLASSNLAQLSTSWSELTHFLGNKVDTEEMRQLFELAPLLSFCNVQGIYVSSSATVAMSTSLQTLIVSHSPSTLWNKITLPSLQMLHIAYPSDNHHWSRLPNFIRRSSCKLQDLSIVVKDRSSAQLDIVDVLKCTPDIERLSIDGLFHVAQFFARLDAEATLVGNAGSVIGFLHKLRSLRCFVDDLVLDWTSIAAFLTNIKSRKDSNLRSFELRCANGYSYQEYGTALDRVEFQRVLEVAQIGLDVRIVNSQGVDWIEGLRQVYNV